MSRRDELEMDAEVPHRSVATGSDASELFGAGLHLVFDHIAVAAQRIRDLLPLYMGLLGGTFVHGGDVPSFGYRSLQLAYPSGKIELMEPSPGSAFFDRFFSSRGPGVHHVTFLVDRIPDAIDAAVAAGFEITSPKLDDPRWREIFIHPREAHGTLIQIAQEGPMDERDVPMTLLDVLEGRGFDGTGVPSP